MSRSHGKYRTIATYYLPAIKASTIIIMLKTIQIQLIMLKAIQLIIILKRTLILITLNLIHRMLN